MSDVNLPQELQHLLAHFSRMVEMGTRVPEEDTPLGRLSRQFFENNWRNCRDGLLRKTSRLRVWPEPSPAPRTFEFEVDSPYKCKRGADAPVELVPGPIRGTIYYRPDIFVNTEDPAIAVALDRSQWLLHPNYSRKLGFICLGELPTSPYPFPLDSLLQHLIYPICTYQHKRPVHPFDLEAARYFAFDPDAMQGLEPAASLY
jgi:hypothetical protein